MKLTFDAIVDHGVLRPLEPQSLAERQRVRVTVEEAVSAPIGANGATNGSHAAGRDREAAAAALTECLNRSTFRSRGPYPSRDELHER